MISHTTTPRFCAIVTETDAFKDFLNSPHDPHIAQKMRQLTDCFTQAVTEYPNDDLHVTLWGNTQTKAISVKIARPDRDFYKSSCIPTSPLSTDDNESYRHLDEQLTRAFWQIKYEWLMKASGPYEGTIAPDPQQVLSDTFTQRLKVLDDLDFHLYTDAELVPSGLANKKEPEPSLEEKINRFQKRISNGIKAFQKKWF